MTRLDKTFDFDAFIDAPNTRAFIGKNYDYYKKIWSIDCIKANRDPRRMMRMHWNWLAIFMVPAWLGYRKMYAHAAVWTGIIALLSFCEEFFHLKLSGGYGVGNFIFALLLKSLYFHHTVEFFEKNRHRSAQDLEALILERGGTSVMQAILATILCMGAIILATSLGYAMGQPTLAIDMDSANVPV